MKFEVEGVDMKKKFVTRHGASAGIYLPKEWIGKPVAVILLEDY